ncbi:MAG: DciA family protein [Patescibacteria group bacterium]|nr:DciA family protein [Patescibacteria group bacterium]
MLQRLDKLMPQSIKRAGVAGGVKAAMILDTVSKVLTERFGERIASAMKPVKIRNRIVTIRCGESVMTEDIRMHEAEIIRDANAKLGGDEIEGLRAVM